MSLKRLGIALLVVLALGAVTANSAMAVATTATASWFKEATKLGEGQANGLAATCATVGGSLVLTSTSGGKAVKIEASEIECPGGKIYNETPAGNTAMAFVTGKLVLKNPKVAEPGGCTVEGGKIETQTFAGELYMITPTSYLRLAPASGAILAEPDFEGSLCAIKGPRQIKGSVFGAEEFATGKAGLRQRVEYSKTINETAGGALTFEGAEAQLAGKIALSLTGGGEFKSE